MPTKIFTTITGPCPFGKNVTIDSPGCRSCEKYYRTGTGMFFWCNHPTGEKSPKKPQRVPEKAETGTQEKRKRGRPPGKATKKAVNRTKTKKR